MANAKKNFKATKKFEQKHLKGVLEKRKSSAKIKQRAQVKAKKQAKRAQDAEFYKADKPSGASKAHSNKPDANISQMSVDEFFKTGFEDIIDKKPSGRASAASARPGKRKRVESEAEPADSFSDSGSDDEAPSGGAPLDSDSDDGEDVGMGMSKSAMDALAQKDPEFYEFLKENDPDALDFDENADLAEIDELSSSEEEEQPRKKQKKGAKKSTEEEDESDDEFTKDNELTRAMVEKWRKSLEEAYSLRAARQIVLAFRCAAHLNEADEENKQRYTINSPEVFHDVLIVALKQVPEVLRHHIPYKESATHRIYISTDTKKFKTLSILIKSYTASVLHLLSTLSDDATLKMTLSALTPLLPYLLSFRKLLKNVIKSVVNFWAQPASSESTRVTAFLVLRRLTVIGDKGIREALLKASYQGLVQGSRIMNANTIQGINLMKNSAAELWGIDQGIGYTTAFTSIRQLAIHLRNSIVNNKNDSFKTVYNWQYVHSLDFWSCVLAEHCSGLKEAELGKESQLRLLIYPLVQVTLGAMRLIPTAAYFPLRFHLIRSLLRISRATGTYIPLASALLEVLNSAEMKKQSKPSTLKQLDFGMAYKAAKSYLKTKVYQNGVGDQVVELFSEYFVLWSTNIAFPEFALPVIVMLKRWLKSARKKHAGNGNAKLNSNLDLLVKKLEDNSKFIEGKRAKVDFAPKDRAQVDAFLKDFEWEKTPVGAFVAAQRKMRAESARVLEQARKEEEKKRKAEEALVLAEKENHDDEGSEEDEEEEAEEDDEKESGEEESDEIEEDDE